MEIFLSIPGAQNTIFCSKLHFTHGYFYLKSGTADTKEGRAFEAEGAFIPVSSNYFHNGLEKKPLSAWVTTKDDRVNLQELSFYVSIIV